MLYTNYICFFLQLVLKNTSQVTYQRFCSCWLTIRSATFYQVPPFQHLSIRNYFKFSKNNEHFTWITINDSRINISLNDSYEILFSTRETMEL